MAETRLVDVYVPVTFDGAVQERAIELNRFLSSGVAEISPLLQNMISVGGNTGEITNFNPITLDEPDYTTDNPANLAVPAKITSTKQRFLLATTHKSWSTMNLARELALQDPFPVIVDSVAKYQASNIEKRIIQSCVGLLNDNVANHALDMTINIANDDALPVLAANQISAPVVMDVQQTMGDHMGDLRAIAMPSIIFTRLKKQDLIDFITPSVGPKIPIYQNMTVIVDDSLPAVAGGNRVTYTCILFGEAVFGMASGQVDLPSELDRVPNAGFGGGQDILHTRRSDLIHPFGFDFTSNTVTGGGGQSADQADLALAVNWDRIWQRKNIPLAFLKVND